jgi:hypothetical protein
MADPQRQHPHPAPPAQEIDAELDLKAIIRFVIGLLVVTLLVLAVMWAMGGYFKAAETAKDPPPSPLVEAQADPIPPGPRLQSTPPRDMEELRAQDHETLTSYGWVDRAGGVARIPIERAMSIVAEKGLGAAAAKKDAK